VRSFVRLSLETAVNNILPASWCEVIVYDYVDRAIPALARMAAKRQADIERSATACNNPADIIARLTVAFGPCTPRTA
jgi:hypothetical protein